MEEPNQADFERFVRAITDAGRAKYGLPRRTWVRRWLENRTWGWRVMRAAKWLRYRPLVPCPTCRGRGGQTCGGEEPEWDDCWECEPFWSATLDGGMEWTLGRVPLLRWPSIWLRTRLGIAGGPWRLSFVGWAKCKIGLHSWSDESDMEPGLELCHRCYESRTRQEVAK